MYIILDEEAKRDFYTSHNRIACAGCRWPTQDQGNIEMHFIRALVGFGVEAPTPRGIRGCNGATHGYLSGNCKAREYITSLVPQGEISRACTARPVERDARSPHKTLQQTVMFNLVG